MLSVSSFCRSWPSSPSGTWGAQALAAREQALDAREQALAEKVQMLEARKKALEEAKLALRAAELVLDKAQRAVVGTPAQAAWEAKLAACHAEVDAKMAAME